MSEEIDEMIEMAELSMESAIDFLTAQLAKVRTGKASPAMFEGISVDYYGSPTPLKQVANIGTVDARTITIQPWEKSMVAPIEQAIFAANMGVTPQNDGTIIRITIPMLTEERRKQYVKQVKDLGENAKVTIRNGRRTANDFVKKQVKVGLSEDAGKGYEDDIQKLTNKLIGKVDDLIAAKEKSIMTI